jgi:hypothetical protein
MQALLRRMSLMKILADRAWRTSTAKFMREGRSDENRGEPFICLLGHEPCGRQDAWATSLREETPHARKRGAER